MTEEGGATGKWREVWLRRLDAVEAAAAALLEEVRALRREAIAAQAISAAPEAMPAPPPQVPASSDESAPVAAAAQTAAPASSAHESAEARAKRIERVMHARAALFLSLFQGNPEHYAVRWEGFKDAERRLPAAGYAPARFRDGRFKPFDEAAAIRHLTGEEVIGAYPMTAGSRTPFLVIDLDGKGEASAGPEKKETAEKDWRRDARAVLAAARKAGVPAQAEISRSGEGAHIWLFFSELVPATLARRLGGALLAAAMSFEGASPELLSFDRMIPAQDELPPGRIGNLVALPLQRRRRDLGFTVFVDEALAPVENQWRLLKNIQRLSAAEAEAVEARLEALFGAASPARLTKAGKSGKARRAGKAGKSAAGGSAAEPLALSASPSSDEVWSFSRTRLEAAAPVLHLRLEATLSADERELTPPLRSALLHLASFANPAFFKAKSRGEPVWQIPRRIFAAFEREGRIHLPRGVAAKALERLRRDGIAYEIEDRRDPGRPLGASFIGALRGEQEKAAELAARAECGILVGMTGFGKTVVGAAAAARSGASTLVLVHAQVLAEQWAAAARAFLGLARRRSASGAAASARSAAASILRHTRVFCGFLPRRSAASWRATAFSSWTNATMRPRRASPT